MQKKNDKQKMLMAYLFTKETSAGSSKCSLARPPYLSMPDMHIAIDHNN